ncbi:zinc-binding alcohol dehydrogenase family protein [candidate division KSB3 bacterium]|uniref:Zinc-binding alcohol dehydrogenase family protein n=1 Tax=candidate division KSB3 bacterium TaxID=2044937 RepID=A0A9D5Q848_9BACT|nr:zinc-binding alcohol dehydrogenase family protein [candidate division KSB3 bacterium]MBD3327569.1 zinc-binding alcohol dehydrogenase family protein [candidate division KSB3 bacterium]
MKAMVLPQIQDLQQTTTPLEYVDIADPMPGEQEILVQVSTCGVCHTELDEIEGRTPPSSFPIVLGHQVVGRVVQTGSTARNFTVGDRVGIAWIYSACGQCKFCLSDQENLCPEFKATGRDANGGYAEYMTVPEGFAYLIPSVFSDSQAAPLLCAGAIGYRSLRLTTLQDGQSLGLTGFGASAHLVLKMLPQTHPNSQAFVFARSPKEREFAKELGAVWAGDTADDAPEQLDAIIDTTPVWKPVVEALRNLAPGGRLVINAIRKEPHDQDYLQKLDYPKHLWLEKEIKSVANVTRRDVSEFLSVAAEIPITPEVQEFRLDEANQALLEVKGSKIRGAKVLKMP